MTSKEKKLEGKVAVITGGNSGIGLATAKLFVEEGAFVYITGRRQKELNEAVEQIGENIKAIKGDVSKIEEIEKIYKEIKKEKGKIDIIFANAGIATKESIEEVTEESYYNIFDINVKGVLFTIQKAIPLLSPSSSIILNASIMSSKGFSDHCLYSASKAAVRSFARSWTNDLKDRNIRVNVISPGPIDTPIFDGLFGDRKMAVLQSYSQLIPQRRFGLPFEVAKSVLFLASDDSSYISGVELFIDGGLTAI